MNPARIPFFLSALAAVALLAGCASSGGPERHSVTGSRLKSESEGQVAAGNSRVYCRDAIERTGAFTAGQAVARSASSGTSGEDCED